MARHADDDAHDAHDGAHDGAHDSAQDDRMNHAILADRERLFDNFIRFTGWNVVAIFAILALLALTQT